MKYTVSLTTICLLFSTLLGSMPADSAVPYIMKDRDAKMHDRVADIKSTFNNFSVVFKGCQRFGSSVTCSYVLRNRGGYGTIMMLPSLTAKLVEASGKQITGGTLEIAGQSGTFARTITLEESIDYTASITFDGVLEDTSMIQILYLPFDKTTTLRYKNVPINN
jgi:hypothetical protein